MFRELRCLCGKLLCKVSGQGCKIDIKCERCKQIAVIDVATEQGEQITFKKAGNGKTAIAHRF